MGSREEVGEARALWACSAEGWIEGMARGEVNRVHLLDAPMLDLAGDVRGKTVLDVGCGEGRFCRMLADRGAWTIGLDPIQAFLFNGSAAGGAYVRAVGESIPIRSKSIDLVVSYLTLIDIPDFRAAISEIGRVLKPGGQVIVANLNSFATTRERAWYRNEQDEKLHVAVEDYYEERSLKLDWGKVCILNWHRPMEAYMQAFLAAGLVLQAFAEPRPTLEAVALHPSMLDEYRVPLFHVMRWGKP